MDRRLIVDNDLLIVAYFMKRNNWKGANKSTFQRVLYFSAALSPIFIPQYDWSYMFSNTIFGPYNSTIKDELQNLTVKNLLEVDRRKIYMNRIEENYRITPKGIQLCEKMIFNVNKDKDKVKWFGVIVKVLSIYGEEFLSKLIKEDPNISYQNEINSRSRLITDKTAENLSKEFFNFVKQQGKQRFNNNIQNDEEYLLFFFDILYRQYRGRKY